MVQSGSGIRETVLGDPSAWNLARCVESLWRARRTIVVSALGAAVLAAAVTLLMPNIYPAWAIFRVKQSGITETETPLREADVKMFEKVIKNQNILRATLEDFNLAEVYDMRMRDMERIVQVRAMKNAPLLELRVEFESAELARDIARHIADAAVVKNASMALDEAGAGREALKTDRHAALEDLEDSRRKLQKAKSDFNEAYRAARLKVLLDRINKTESRLRDIDKAIQVQSVDPIKTHYPSKKTEHDKYRKSARLSIIKHQMELLQIEKAEGALDLFRLEQEITYKTELLRSLDTQIADQPEVQSGTRALIADPEAMEAFRSAGTTVGVADRYVEVYINPVWEHLVETRVTTRTELDAARSKKKRVTDDLAKVESQLNRTHKQLVEAEAGMDDLELETTMARNEFVSMFDTSPQTYNAEKAVMESQLTALREEYETASGELIAGQLDIARMDFDYGLRKSTFERIERKIDEIDVDVKTRTKELMLIDPPIIRNKKVAPKRSLIVISVFLLALLLSSGFVLLVDYYRGLRSAFSPAV